MILDKFSLKDKVAIVTGANTGLGQGICWAFAEAGAKIAGVGRSDMTQTREYIEKIGGEFFEIKADLMSSDCVLPILDSTVSHYGKVDILVNNAGIIRRDDLENYSMKDWDDVMNTNIRTLFSGSGTPNDCAGPWREDYQYRLYALLSGRDPRSGLYSVEERCAGLNQGNGQ